MISHFRSIWLADSMNLRFRIRRFSSFLLDISSEYINITKCRNQNELTEKMKNKLTTKEAYTSFQAIDRALFLPKTEYREPYVNESQNLGFSEATLSTPYHHALILSILHENGLKSGKRVIDIGYGSGYFCLVAKNSKTLATKGQQVVRVANDNAWEKRICTLQIAIRLDGDQHTPIPQPKLALIFK